MKHPIYRDAQDRYVMESIKDFGQDKVYETILPTYHDNDMSETECKAFVNRIATLVQVEEHGCQLIQLQTAEHWNESMSEKTLKQMGVSDIKLPFKAFTVDLTSAAWSTYEYVHVTEDGERILFTFESKQEGGTAYHQMHFDYGKNLSEEVESILNANFGDMELTEQMAQLFKAIDEDDAITQRHEQLKEKIINTRSTIYKTISIIMYTTMFRKVTDKVLLKKIVNKGSKKRKMPQHTTNIVYLSQPSYTLSGADRTGSKTHSDKTWMQKGHFRRQPYGKRYNPTYKEIWIDAMWKGKGSKVMSKVYKV